MGGVLPREPLKLLTGCDEAGIYLSIGCACNLKSACRNASGAADVNRGVFMNWSNVNLFAVALASLLFGTFAAAHADESVKKASPIYGVTIPDGYRQWEMIAPSEEAGSLNELRVILGNPAAVKAIQTSTQPFPDGTILAKLAWKRVPSTAFSTATIPGAATAVSFMVKDSKKYASTGGWGFGQFIDGQPVSLAKHQACFACHEARAKDHDFVFTRFAP
jgi:hypothetical protein